MPRQHDAPFRCYSNSGWFFKFRKGNFSPFLYYNFFFIAFPRGRAALALCRRQGGIIEITSRLCRVSTAVMGSTWGGWNGFCGMEWGGGDADLLKGLLVGQPELKHSAEFHWGKCCSVESTPQKKECKPVVHADVPNECQPLHGTSAAPSHCIQTLLCATVGWSGQGPGQT